MMEVFQIWLDLVFHFFLLYIVGVLLLTPFKKLDWPKHHLFFLQLVLGTIGLVSGYSIYFTKGYTLLAIIPILYIITLSKAFNYKFSSFHIFRKELLISIGVLSILLGIQFFRNDYFNPGLVSYSDIDFGIYATVSEYLMHTGLEISSPWYANSSLGVHLVPQPYHYGDLWLNAFCLIGLFDLPSLSAYIYVFIPLISMVAFWGVLSILIFQKKYEYKQLVFTFFLTLANIGIYYPLTNGLYCNGLTSPKTFFLLLLLSSAILFLQKRNYWITGLCLALIPISNILFLPAVYGSLGLLFSYLFLYNKYHLKALLPIFLVPFIGLTYIMLFYSFFGKLFTGVSSVETDWLNYIYRFVRGIGSGALRLLIFEFPFSILLFLIIPIWRKLKKVDQLIFVLLIGFIVGGLAGKAIFNLQESEINQVFYLVANPTVIVFLAYFLGLSEWRSTFKHAHWATYILMLFSIINLLFFFDQRDTVGSRKFIEEVRGALKGKNKMGANISNPELENIYTYDPRMCTYCGVLKMIGQDYWVNRLDLVSSLDSLKYPEKRNSVSIAPFYQFMNQQKASGRWKDLAHLSAEWHEAQIDFINTMKVDFIVLEKDVTLPIHLSTCTERKIHDPISGISIILLKRPCEY